MQRTVVILKPDALQRGLAGEIIQRFEKKGLKLVALKMIKATDALLDLHYAHHAEKPFFAGLKRFMMSSPLVCMLWEGIDVVAVVRKMVGATNGREAEFGSIRGDYSNSQSANLIHVSDSIEAAGVEQQRFFRAEVIFEYDLVVLPFLYGEDEMK